ncbi:endolytic transglycosylase MltG [Microbacterium sp.]|uniref:endolytic transglycosylase MltG n=1 Tax=Microbacterium sp. TaxID=51671 RepID=UPI0028117B0A|nr:endolytic transglycosylase MltG [Microbacterium sp.]
MSDPDDSPKRQELGDLFSNLPTASSPLPARDGRHQPAPGSRRARREAQQNAGGPASAEPVGSGPDAATPAASPDTASSDAASPDSASSAARPEPASASGHQAQEIWAVTPVASGAAASSQQSGRMTEAGAPERAEGRLAVEDDPHSIDALFAPEQHRHVPKKRRGRGCLIGLIVILAILGGIAAGGVWAMNTYGDRINEIMGWGEPKDYEPGQASGEALVTIKSGDTGSPVSTALFEAGVTKTDRVFYDYLIEENPSVTFYPGVYKLQKKMTAAAALKALEDPANRMENTVRIPEGSTVESALPRIVDGVGVPLEELQAAVKDPSAYGVQAERLDGWLFPAVYTFDPGSSAKDIIARMVERTRQSLEDAGVPDADAQRVLTIASIIEREARTPDFAKVSRVIQNRIDEGMKLQMDSTAQYGYGELHAGKASTSSEAQNDPNEWNTYYITGLPKTPIANSSDAAIDAAMHPADGPWLYFVTIDFSTGETQFSETYAQHQQGIEKMRAWCRSNPDYKGC